MSIKKETIKVYDMTCNSCENRVERAIKKLEGVTYAKASFSDQQVIIEYDSGKCTVQQFKDAIIKAGYSIEKSNKFKIAGIFIIAAAIILIGSSSKGIDITKLNGATYFVLFIVGMLTSIHCVGMCGGIMLTQSISKEHKSRFKTAQPAILYNLGRIVSYTIIGGLVGALGSVLSLSVQVKAGMQIFAGIFMIIMGLNMSGFSLFRKLNLHLPWSFNNMKKKPKTPFLIGILNGLMPCGPLQTMQLYALGTGSALKGALSLFIFALGTVPLMTTFGIVSSLLSKGYTKTILKFSGILVVILGLIMGGRGLSLAGVYIPRINADTLAATISGKNNSNTANGHIGKAVVQNGVQVIKMTADNNGYTPNAFYVQKNIPLRWEIDGKELNSCNYQIIVPSLNKQVQLKQGQNVIQFTPGGKDISFSCGMGMIRGVIKVVDDLNSADTSKSDPSIPAPNSGMSCCKNPVPSNPGPSTPAKPSIYGNDISKVSTDRIIHKSVISGNSQTALFNGKGYEFEPIINVVNKGMKTTLTFDLNSFDTPTGKFSIVDITNNETLAEVDAKKGAVSAEITFNKDGGYAILQNNNILGLIEVVDDINKADLEQIRSKYINQ